MVKLSFIIPCYNAEKYISRCLDSIYNQDIPESEFEVICVNDCSPDNMREIILEYQKQHSNLILIEHEISKRPGGARNTGLKNAKGKYIWFIDSDDYIKVNCLKELLFEMEKYSLDVLNFELMKEDSSKQWKLLLASESTEIITGAQFLDNLAGRYSVNGSSSSKIYKADFLFTQNLKFPEIGFFEDQVFNLQAVFLAKNFKHKQIAYYYYCYNENSIMNTRSSYKVKLDVLCYANRILSFTREVENTYPALAEIVRIQMLYYIDNILAKQYILCNNKERKTAKCYILENYDMIKQYTKLTGWKLALLKNIEIASPILMIVSPPARFIRWFYRELLGRK